MTIQWEVDERKPNAAMGSGGGFNVQNGATKTFNIRIWDDADPNWKGEDLDPQKLYDAIVDLPRVGTTALTYSTRMISGNVEQVVHPWVLCNSKRITRHATNNLLFRAECSYGSVNANATDADLAGKSLEASAEDYGWLTTMTTGSEEKVIYEEPTTGGNVIGKMPTGSYFADPFMRTYGTNEYIIAFYRNYNSIREAEDFILKVLFTINEKAREDAQNPNGGWEIPNRSGAFIDPHYAKIIEADYRPAIMPTTGNPNPTSVNTYLFVFRVDTKDQNWEGGFDDRRALIDTYELIDGKRTPVHSAGTGERLEVLIQGDPAENPGDTNPGERKANQDGPPSWLTVQTQPEQDFYSIFNQP